MCSCHFVKFPVVHFMHMCVMQVLEILYIIMNQHNISKAARLSLFVNKEVGLKLHFIGF